MNLTSLSRFRLLLILVSIPILLSGCGSSGDGGSGDDDEPSLVEATADLPKPDIDFGETENSQAAETEEVAGVTGNPNISYTMRSFLWKPESERDGNLAILVDPVGVRVEVFGSISETLNDTGPSNGRGTTARAGHSGCDFGSNIRIRFYNRSGRRLGFVNGEADLTIRDGCERVEFQF